MSVLHVLRQVSLHVERQVVAAREAPFADFALEGLGARVLPVMPRQLVRPGRQCHTEGQMWSRLSKKKKKKKKNENSINANN